MFAQRKSAKDFIVTEGVPKESIMFKTQIKMPRDTSGCILVYTHFQKFICMVNASQSQLHFPLLTQLNNTPIHLNMHLEQGG